MMALLGQEAMALSYLPSAANSTHEKEHVAHQTWISAFFFVAAATRTRTIRALTV